ncbi:uncharacterized protein BT62DRAFT_998179 [Guyanagaster necrorhizus]|uniref:Uncharacterized protein n=1 Tax=Guyanagaster necrorhizus TaxID=856835 RepID=A0A9P7VFX5_9AGAR|nr:uncharacterized protein BT62DRAFT_998179 [Guyanagaster necrorhizus MCA 3950]KAG7439665.1 hypothetical protein BT62DRAFT_998179 [Guyanagaster necrorhizus MCA 3950]
MSTSPHSLHDWPELFTQMCSSTISAGIHCVTFQTTPGTPQRRPICLPGTGCGWSGHGGDCTAEYSAATLPGRIEELRGVVERYQGWSRRRYTKRVQEIVNCQIYYFDKGLGDAIKELCPDPSLFDDEQGRNLANANKDVFQRAYYGSTLAVALLDNERNHLWVAGLCDSTVGALPSSYPRLYMTLLEIRLAYTSPEGYGDGKRLLTLHSKHTPLEYFTIMRHPTIEKTTIVQDERLLGVH